jgi:hypothetical protein
VRCRFHDQLGVDGWRRTPGGSNNLRAIRGCVDCRPIRGPSCSTDMQRATAGGTGGSDYSVSGPFFASGK